MAAPRAAIQHSACMDRRDFRPAMTGKARGGKIDSAAHAPPFFARSAAHRSSRSFTRASAPSPFGA